MVDKTFVCEHCGAKIEINSYRKFIVCPYCDTKYKFPGFDFPPIDRRSNKYGAVKLETDCPACRGKNMFLFGNKWHCEDCGYTIPYAEMESSVLWFCDDCDAYLNMQEGFTDESGVWKCTECGYVNDVSAENIIEDYEPVDYDDYTGYAEYDEDDEEDEDDSDDDNEKNVTYSVINTAESRANPSGSGRMSVGAWAILIIAILYFVAPIDVISFSLFDDIIVGVIAGLVISTMNKRK